MSKRRKDKIEKGVLVSSVISCIAVAAISFSLISGLAAQGTEDTINVTVNAPEYVEEGEIFDVTIDVDSIMDFNTGLFDLSFNSSVVNITGVANGRLDETAIPISIWTFVDSDTIRVMPELSGITGVSGTGYLTKISFEVVGNRGDRSVLDISNGMLVNTEAEEIPAEWIDDEIRIGVEEKPTPTPAPTPTPSPTPSPSPTPTATSSPTPTPTPSPTPTPTPMPIPTPSPTPTPTPTLTLTPAYDYLSETSIEGEGTFSIDKKVRNRAAAVNMEKHVRCNGSMDGFVANEYLLEEARGNNPNFEQVDAIDGYRATAPGHYLYGEERIRSSFVFGGTGARIEEKYDVLKMDTRLESINLHSTGDQRYKTELETINDFSGYLLIDARQSIPGVKRIEDRQEFFGNFTVRKHIIFKERPNRTTFEP